MIAHQIKPRPIRQETLVRNRTYRAFVRRHPCVVPNCYRRPIEFMHGKAAGRGLKGCDLEGLPGCRHHHQEAPYPEAYHSTSEERWAACHGLDLEAERRKLRLEFERRAA